MKLLKNDSGIKAIKSALGIEKPKRRKRKKRGYTKAEKIAFAKGKKSVTRKKRRY